MLKVLHVDTETTGDNYAIHAIHQIAGGIEINGEIVDEFDFKVKPYPTAIIDSAALKISGVTPFMLNEYELGLSVMRKLSHIIERHINITDYNDKFFICAYNGSHFERNFIKKFFEQNSSKMFRQYFWSAVIDTMALSINALRYERASMTDFKLETVAKRLNIDVDTKSLHNAAYDWKISRAIYQVVNKNS